MNSNFFPEAVIEPMQDVNQTVNEDLNINKEMETVVPKVIPEPLAVDEVHIFNTMEFQELNYEKANTEAMQQEQRTEEGVQQDPEDNVLQITNKYLYASANKEKNEKDPEIVKSQDLFQ